MANKKKDFRRNGKSGQGGESESLPTLRVTLTKREQQFVKEYLTDFNGTRAYMQTFNKDIPCKRSTAEVMSCKLLKQYHIMTEVDNRITEMFRKIDIESDAILAQQAILAFIDSRTFFNEDQTFKKIDELNIAQQAAIQEIQVEELFEGQGAKRKHIGKLRKVKFYSRQKALDNLMKYKKLMGDGGNNYHFGDKQEVSLTIAADQLEAKLGVNKLIKLRNDLKESEE